MACKNLFKLAFFGLVMVIGISLYASTVQDVVIRLDSPKAGETLTPGQTVKVSWESKIPADLDLTWCEQEVFLSLDGGATFTRRITGTLGPLVKSFVWTVPNLQTNRAVLNVRFGSEAGPRLETAHIQYDNQFRISSSFGIEDVNLKKVSPAQAQPGSEVRIRWKSTVTNVDKYNVQLSSDAGGHFNSIGETRHRSFSWKVPSDYAGHATFKVIAITRDGRQIESGVSGTPDVVIN